MPLSTTIFLPAIHVDSIELGAGFPWTLSNTNNANSANPPLITDYMTVDTASLRMHLKRPGDADETTALNDLPVSVIDQTEDALSASYAFRSQDIATTRQGRIGNYIGYLSGATTDGKRFRTPSAMLPVVGAFRT